MRISDGKVLVAISGGVDSAVAAFLLREEGYEVIGAYLCLRTSPGQAPGGRRCCTPADAEDARKLADALGIDLITISATEAFRPIIQDFASQYARGRTPNPCIHCNAKIKFGMLFDVADSLGARYVATGHYARLLNDDGRYAILRAKDIDKDQSYALFSLDRRRLGRILLPIGELAGKAELRRIAREHGLVVHDKPESQEVCFVPDAGYAEILERMAPEALREGDIVDSAGQVLGRHDGYGLFTIGQRRGIGVAAKQALYVTRIDPASATVTVGTRDELMATKLTASGANWHSEVDEHFRATVQVRYNHRGAEATVRTIGADGFEVDFDQPVIAPTPGQAAVVYAGHQLLGGGWIEQS